MAKTASLNIRLEPDVKKAAEMVYSRYGLSLTEAVTVFIHQSCNVGGLPFDLRPTKQSGELMTRPSIQDLFKLCPADFIEDEELDWGAPVGDELW